MHSVPYKTLLFLSSLQTVQIISCLFPQSSTSGMPWNYEALQFLWHGLAVSVSPPELLRWLGVSDYLLVGCVLGLLAEQVLVMAVVMLTCVHLPQYDFVSELCGTRMEVVPPWLFTLHETCSIILLRVLFYPLVYTFSIDATCLFQYTCLGWVIVPDMVIRLEAVALCFLILLKYTDLAFVGNLRWATGDLESLSSCVFRGVLTWLEVTLVVITGVVPYRSHPVVYGLMLVAFGTIHLNYLYQKLPFHQMLMNNMRTSRGLFFVWSGLVCLIANLMGGYSQASFGPTALYWLTMILILPMVWGMYNTRAQKLGVVRKPERAFEVEHMIRAVLRAGTARDEAKLDKVISSSMQMFPLSVSLTVWTVYYYIQLNDFIFVKVALSKLMSMRKSVLSLVEAQYAVFYVENWLRSSVNEREAIEYLNMRKRYLFVRQKDQEICERLHEVFDSIGQKGTKFDTLVTSFHKVESMITACKHYYAVSVKTRQSKDFLDSYAGFLEMLQREKKAMNLHSMSAEIVKAQVKRRDGKVSLFDSQIMIVTMSLASRNLGFILSAKGSELLGYHDEQVVGAHHSVLIPPPHCDNHDNMLKRITRFRHKHPVYESLHRLYFMDRARYLTPADWKVCLINLPGSGELAVLAAVRPHDSYEDVAFVSAESMTLTAMVKCRQTRGFELFLQAAGMKDVSVLGLSNVENWNGSVTLHAQKDVIPRQNAGLIHYMLADTLLIFGLRKQLILRLVESTDHRHVPMTSGSIPLSPAFLACPKHLNWRLSTHEILTTTSQVLKSESASKFSNSSSTQSNSKSTHRKHLDRLRKLTWGMKAGAVGSVVVQTVLAVVFVVYCELQLEQVEEVFSLVGTFQSAQVWTLKTSLATRDLFLRDSEALRTSFREAGSNLKVLSEEVRTKLSSQGTLWSSTALATNLWWQYGQKGFTSHYKNLVDTLDLLAGCALAISDPSQDRTSLAVLTLYRNAHAETMEFLQSQFQTLLNKAQGMLEDKLPTAMALVSISAILFVLEVALLAALVTALGRFRRHIWSFIFTMPPVLLSLSKAVVANRLSLEFGQDTQPMEHSEGAGYRYQRSSYERALYLLFGVVVLLTIGCSVAGGVGFSSELISSEKVITQEPITSVNRVTALLYSLLYMRESLFPDLLLPSLFAASLHTSNTTAAWQQLLTLQIERESKFCEEIDLASVFDPNFNSLSGPPPAQLGLHSGVIELALYQQAISRMPPSTLLAADISAMTLYAALEPALLSTMTSLNQQQQARQHTNYRTMTLGVAGFNVAVLALVAGVGTLLLLKVNFTQFLVFLRREWDLVLLFQDDDQGSLAVRLKGFSTSDGR